MSLAQSQPLQQVQRIQMDIEGQSHSKRLKISVENYDGGLGWYSAGSLSIPIHQLPLLEQQLQSLRDIPAEDGDTHETKLVPFPGLRVVPQD